MSDDIRDTTTGSTTPAPNDDLALARGIRDAVRAGVHMVRMTEEKGALTLTQINILNSLSAGPLSIGLLAGLAGMTQPGMTQQIDKLEGADVVRRFKDGRDARITKVELTDHGRAVRASDNAKRDSTIAARFDLLSDEDREAIARAIEPLARFGTSYVKQVREEQR
ncbi:MAG TPA: MarR family transcriptional regulator [Candidatus Corynebacterium avicola]|uniref:MarR family transcriptional regulator n=1 Tax=Candidatus Corynebacterium avicola TaxID=2838527 RepID=A0A9D1UL79_9CORY|nr:MarR family transcriptional regulator [Candidatus Corynebacterium avicola]